jgi:DNA-binding MarR family transcriptional regulator
VLLALTAKGKRLMSSVFPEFNREEARLMSALSSGEVATLTQGLRKAIASLDD